MAKLYEIEQAILECIDTETGEIVDIERLEALQIERDTKIENIALWYKNLLSDAEQYKAEKDNFAQKEKASKKKAESLKNYLDSVLSGTAYKSTRVNVTYRKSEAVIIDDILAVNENYLKYADPEVDKTAVKNAIKQGEEVKGVHIEERNNISIK